MFLKKWLKFWSIFVPFEDLQIGTKIQIRENIGSFWKFERLFENFENYFSHFLKKLKNFWNFFVKVVVEVLRGVLEPLSSVKRHFWPSKISQNGSKIDQKSIKITTFQNLSCVLLTKWKKVRKFLKYFCHFLTIFAIFLKPVLRLQKWPQSSKTMPKPWFVTVTESPLIH